LALLLAALVSLEGNSDAARGGAALAHRGAGVEPPVRWQAALDAVPDAVIVLDRDGAIEHINPAAREIYTLLRPGGQPSLLSRDPDFLQAIDEIFDDGRQRIVEIQERVPIDRRVRITLTSMADDAPVEKAVEEAPRV